MIKTNRLTNTGLHQPHSRELTLVFVLVVFAQCCLVVHSLHSMRNATIRTQGSVIPKPNKIRYDNYEYLILIPSKIKDGFRIDNKLLGKCSIVELAIDRYLSSHFFEDIGPEIKDVPNFDELKYVGILKSLKLASSNDSEPFLCEQWPHSNMDESYTLVVDKTTITAILRAKTSWGILRGLETFSQLIFGLAGAEDIKQTKNSHGIRGVVIEDNPRFKHRGLMLDTARHYIPLQTIRGLLDVMAMNKLNVFHWHIVDDQSFPYESPSFTSSRQGSFRPDYTYTGYDIALIIQHAKTRGIRVIPEFDTPGHTYALRHVPYLLTPCYDTKTKKPDGDFGPLDPTRKTTYDTISKLLKEVSRLFVDEYFHGGGDEVEFDCWRSNPDITDWMKANNITNNYEELSNYYIRRLHDMVVGKYNKTMMVWQEVFDMGANLPEEGTIIQVWKDIDNRTKYMSEMAKVVNAGYRAVLSSCWYLNYIAYGPDWLKYYRCDPADTSYISEDKRDLVLGGEICMWTEYVDATNLMTRLWPRASAAAERLWTEPDHMDANEFLHRLEQHRCRLIYRGYQAEPVNGPGYC